MAAALTVLEDDRFRRRADTRLLSAEAEVGLAVLLRGGPDRLAGEPDDDTLSGLPHDDLRIRARDCLVLHNQRLVHKLVPRYLEQGLDYEDLFQHGALGLMRAARKFDPSKGFKFSTYATWWIRQSISRGIADEGAVIRVPVHMHEQIRKVALAERTLAVQGRAAGVADVAVYCDMTMQKVEEARKLSRRTDSLDRVVGDGVTLGDFIGWTNPLPPVDKAVLDAMLLEQALAVVDTFAEREARILVRRLGLDGDQTLTLDELGREFGVTRERIRQIEVKILPVFRQRLREAGLAAAYRYDGGPDPEAGEPASRQVSGRVAATRARAHRKNSGEKRTPDVLRPDTLQDASREVPAQSAETVQRSAAERLGSEAAAADPADHTTTDGIPSAVLMAEQEEPQEQAERRSEERPDDPRPLPEQRAGSVTADGSETGSGLLPQPRTEAPEPPKQLSSTAPAAIEASGPSATEPAAPAWYTADWRQALRMPTEFGGGVAWLAEYALLAVGHVQLTVLLGLSPADAVVRAVRERAALDRSVVKALEVLRTVFDAVKQAGLTPEDFFERPSAELRGVSPRTYLAERPLVHSEPRLAVRAALREFVIDLSSRVVPEVAPAGAAPDGLMAQPSGPDRVPTSGRGGPAEVSAPSSHGLGAGTRSLSRELPDARARLPQPKAMPVVAGSPDGQTDGARVQTAVVPVRALPQGEEERPQLSIAPDHPADDDSGRDGALRDTAAMAAQEPVSLVKAGRRLVAARIAEGPPVAETGDHGFVRSAGAAEKQSAGSNTALEERSVSTGSGQESIPPAPEGPAEGAVGPRPVRVQEGSARRQDETAPVPTAAGPGSMPTRADTVRRLVQLQAKADRQLAQALAEAEEERAGLRAEAEQHLADARRAHEAELTRARDEHHRQLAEERSAGDARVIAAEADSERRLDALEETLLRRMDRALLRKEQYLRAQAEERIARLEDGHREAQRTLVEHAEHAEQRERAARTALAAAGERCTRAEQRAKDAEQVARTTEHRALDAEHRASTAEERAAVLYQRANEAQRRAEETGQRLRRYTEEGEARITGLEQRLRQAEALLAERDAALRTAQQQASAAEQRAAERIAQAEHEAWARIAELQRQLAAEGEVADRSTLRSRWRRS
ncbi:sigma-70 family RNA polymerase sigma factor [Streptomyces sp. NPDC005329]|uniref:sigma-70 family RNA polymerase sigma factor n=1 Tax=Streptomyces sp. NPDC005329 TaxID=3157034 RepID=UPI0033A78799